MHTKTKISVADPDPGSGAFFTSESGIRIRDGGKSGSGILDNISARRLRHNCFGLKILRFLLRIRDLLDAGSGMEKYGSGIRNKHPESATLQLQ